VFLPRLSDSADLPGGTPRRRRAS